MPLGDGIPFLFNSQIIAFIQRGGITEDRRPLWPLFLPLICAVLTIGIFYALMIGTSQAMEMVAIQEYSVGAGTLLILLVSLPLWRGMKPAMSFAGVPGEISSFTEAMTEYEKPNKGGENSGRIMDARMAVALPDTGNGENENRENPSPAAELKLVTPTSFKGLELKQQVENANQAPAIEPEESAEQVGNSAAPLGNGALTKTEPEQESVEGELAEASEVQGREDFQIWPIEEGDLVKSVPLNTNHDVCANKVISKSMATDGAARSILALDDISLMIKEKFATAMADIEASNRDVLVALLSKAYEIDTTMTEYRNLRKKIQDAMLLALDTLLVADERLGRMERVVMEIKQVISSKAA